MLSAIRKTSGAAAFILICTLVSACGNDNNSTPTPAPTNTQQPGAVPTVTITIPPNAMSLGNQAFGTNPLPIQEGTNVKWINGDSITHTVTSDTAGLFDSGNLAPGQSFTWTANRVGSVSYHCNIHPTMMGTLMISPAASPSPNPSASPVTFARLTQDVLAPHCNSCHSGPSASAGLDFTSYSSVVHNTVLPDLVVPGKPTQSALYNDVAGTGIAPGASADDRLTTTEIQEIFDWIQAGAPES